MTGWRSAAVVWLLSLGVSAADQVRVLHDDPPRASLISISVAPTGEAEINGASGAVRSGAAVVCLTVDTGHYSWVLAAADGSFRCSQFAPAGSSLLIKSMPDGRLRSQLSGEMDLYPYAGTFIRVPGPPSRDGEVVFAGADLTFSADRSQARNPLPAFRFEGSIPRLVYQPGEVLTVRGNAMIDSPVLEGHSGQITARPAIGLQRITGPDGAVVTAQPTFASAFMTPTGFPIEGFRPTYFGLEPPAFELQRPASNRASADITASLFLSQTLPAGYYRPYLAMNFRGVPAEPLTTRPVINELLGDSAGRTPVQGFVYLPVIRVGNPAAPRIPWTLFTEQVTEGANGVRALEDRERFGISPRTVFQPDVFVLPRRDRRTGAPLRYRIEPHAPTIGAGDRGNPPVAPLVPFRFPSGSLRARIIRPDGGEVEIGPTAFVQSRVANSVTPNGFSPNRGSGHLTDSYQLTTLDPRFEIAFDQDGRHRIHLEGAIEDEWGHRWESSGTYDVFVGDSLLLDTAILPGTPFESGDFAAPAVTVIPPVPAEIEIRIRHLPDSVASRAIERVISGRANRYGFFRAEPFHFSSPGEYRIDIIASWTDGQGNWRFGARSWGSVVASEESAIIARGARGIDGITEIRPQWFTRTQIGAGVHANLPWHGGDVLWAQKSDSTNTTVKFQDREGHVSSLMLQRRLTDSAAVVEGEIPTVIATSDGSDAHLHPTRIDFWSYVYRSIQRPLVRVRELVAVDQLGGAYWRFQSKYGGQSGVGIEGDLPNDFKFQFGGVVIRGAAVEAPMYAAYGSLFVLVPDGADGGGTRVFPPFQGNGGGPTGGPLFRLQGKEIDLFFHCTGIRPGSILHVGERATFAGYAAPTLPSKIEIAVTSPSGVSRTIRGQASNIGYFHDPAQEFSVTEAGVWKARVKILHDGRTSAGQTTEPYPTGDVLGSRDGEFWFYVVDRKVPQLELSSTPQFVRPADGPIAFTVVPPAGLTNVELHTTTTMPGFILEETTSQSLQYVYDAPKLAVDFPNLDLHDDDGLAGADAITISFLLSGTDTTGARRHFARQIVIQGEELQVPDQKPGPTRRRAARS